MLHKESEPTLYEALRRPESVSVTKFTSSLFARYGILLALAAMVLIGTFISDRFLTTSNLLNVMRQISLTGILGAGMTVVIISGGIDLSVGASIALASCVMAKTLLATQNVWLTYVAGIGITTFVGLCVGLFVTKIGIEPFIATLAVQIILRGITYLYTNAQPISVYTVSEFAYLGQSYWGPIPIPLYFMIATFVVTYFMLKKTKFGRYVYAIGGNTPSAHLAGINVHRCKILVYVFNGILTGISAILLTSRLLSGVPTLGVGYETTAITMTILGGTSFSGGQGNVWLTMVGAAILGVLSNGMNLMNLSPFYQDISTGVVILLAVAGDRIAHRNDL